MDNNSFWTKDSTRIMLVKFRHWEILVRDFVGKEEEEEEEVEELLLLLLFLLFFFLLV